MPAPASQWPSLRKRLRSVGMDMYAEAVGDAMSVAFRLLPENSLGVPAAKVGSARLSWMGCWRSVSPLPHSLLTSLACSCQLVAVLRSMCSFALVFTSICLNPCSALPHMSSFFPCCWLPLASSTLASMLILIPRASERETGLKASSGE